MRWEVESAREIDEPTYSKETPSFLPSTQTTLQCRAACSPSIVNRNICGSPNVLTTLSPAPLGVRSFTVQGSPVPAGPKLMRPRSRTGIRASLLRPNIIDNRSFSPKLRADCRRRLGAGIGVGHRGRQHVVSGLIARVADERRPQHARTRRVRNRRDVDHHVVASWTRCIQHLVSSHSKCRFALRGTPMMRLLSYRNLNTPAPYARDQTDEPQSHRATSVIFISRERGGKRART